MDPFRPPQRPSVSERSSLWGMATAGAIGGGFAYGMRGRWGDLHRAAVGPGTTALDRVQNLRGTAAKYSLSPFSNVEALGDLAVASDFHGAWRSRVADLTYESIMGARVPVGHSTAQSALARVLEAGGGLESVYGSAMSEIKAAGGDTARFTRAVNKITGDFGEGVASMNTSRFGNVPAAMSKAGVNQKIGEELLNTAESAELENIMGRLKSKGVFGDLVGDASLRRIGAGDDAVTMARISVQGVGDINLPLSNKGIMYGGEHYTTKYITRGAWDVTGAPNARVFTTKTYNEHYLDTLVSSMSDDFGNRRVAKEALHQTNLRVAQGMMDEADTAAGKAAIFAEDLVTSGGALKQSMAMDQLVFGGKKLTPALLEEVIGMSAEAGTPLTPFAGAGAVGKGALLKGDLRAHAYGGLGELFPAQKQPFQFARGDFGLSQEAIDMASQPAFRFGGPGAGDSYFNKYIDRLSNYDGYQRANLLTVYATDAGSTAGIMADEMGYMSKNVADLQRYERMRSVTIRAGENMPGHQAIIDQLSPELAYGERVNFKEGIAITNPAEVGIDVKTNKAFASGAPGMSQEMVGFKRLDAERVKVYMRETHDMQDIARKYFGQGDVKHMIQGVSQGELRGMLEQTGFTGQKVLGAAQPEMYLNASRFQGGKNPAALAQQQMTAMQIMLASRADRAGTMSTEAQAFMSSPAQFLEDTVFSNSKATTLAGLQDEVQVALVKKAQSLGISRGGSEFGMIFGAMGKDVTEGLWKRGILSDAEARAVMGSSHVVGMSAPSLGDLAFEGGSGKMGTMDVAGFRVLSQKGYTGADDLGARAALDIAERTMSPGAYDEIAKMHGSIIQADQGIVNRAAGLIGGDDATDLANYAGDLVSEEGRWFSTGKAGKSAGIASKIYIPGTAGAEQLLPSINTATGEVLESEVHRSLGSLKYALGKGDDELIRSAASDLAAASHSQYARATTARGKVAGSRVLTGQQMTAAQQEVMGDVLGVSKQTGLGMFDEMIERAPSQRRAFLESQRAAFEAGEAVTAVGWRHPNVGPESVQFLNMQAMDAAEDAIVYMPQKMGQMSIDGTKVTRDLSPLVGWKGDFDKDQFVISAIGQERVDQGARRALNNSVNANYNKYLGRHYAMDEMISRHGDKAKSPMRGISALRQEARAHGYVKMATGETNVALQKAKVAIAANAPEHYDELATAMWHLEETAAIGSKHGTLGGGDLYKQISSAIKDQDEAKLAGVFETVFGKGEQTIKTVVGGEATNVTMNPQRYAERIMGAIRQTPEEVFASVELSQAAKGTSRASIQKMQEQFLMMQSGRSRDVAAALGGAGDAAGVHKIEGAFGKVRERARAVGQVLGRNKKPLMLGAAVAGAFMLAAPSISGAIKSNPNRMGAAGGRNIDPEASAPPGGLEMNPPKNAIMKSPRAYEMTSRVQGNYNATDAHKDNAAIMRQIAAARAGGGNASVNIQDNRSVLDSRMMANKIHERM